MVYVSFVWNKMYYLIFKFQGRYSLTPSSTSCCNSSLPRSVCSPHRQRTRGDGQNIVTTIATLKIQQIDRYCNRNMFQLTFSVAKINDKLEIHYTLYT